MKNESAIVNVSLRQLEVVRWTCLGMKSREIAEQMDIVKRTVDRHLDNLYGRWGFANKVELVVYALTHGWISAADLPSRETLNRREAQDRRRARDRLRAKDLLRARDHRKARDRR